MQREGLLLLDTALKQFGGLLPEEVEQERFAIASRIRLLEVGKMRALRLPLVAGDDSFPAQRASVATSPFGFIDVDDMTFLVASCGV